MISLFHFVTALIPAEDLSLHAISADIFFICTVTNRIEAIMPPKEMSLYFQCSFCNQFHEPDGLKHPDSLRQPSVTMICVSADQGCADK